MKVQEKHGKVTQNMHGASRNYRYVWDVSLLTSSRHQTTPSPPCLAVPLERERIRGGGAPRGEEKGVASEPHPLPRHAVDARQAPSRRQEEPRPRLLQPPST